MGERAAPWRSKPPLELASLIQTLSTESSDMFLVGRPGPTSFLLCEREDVNALKLRVMLGSVPACSCRSGSSANIPQELCRHIVFVMLRVLRVPAGSPLLWQLSLTDRELDQVLTGTAARGAHAAAAAAPAAGGSSGSEGDCSVPRRQLEEDEPCAICYDSMGSCSLEALVWCRHGCGHNVHGRCMRVWSTHQTEALQQELTCPMCRSKWGDFSWRPPAPKRPPAERKPEAHAGVQCGACKMAPLVGPRYRCLQCSALSLCHSCFASGAHPQHPFACQRTPTSPEAVAERDLMMPSCFGVAGVVAGGRCTAGAAAAAASQLSLQQQQQEQRQANGQNNHHQQQGQSAGVVAAQGPGSSFSSSSSSSASLDSVLGQQARRQRQQQEEARVAGSGHGALALHCNGVGAHDTACTGEAEAQAGVKNRQLTTAAGAVRTKAAAPSGAANTRGTVGACRGQLQRPPAAVLRRKEPTVAEDEASLLSVLGVSGTAAAAPGTAAAAAPCRRGSDTGGVRHKASSSLARQASGRSAAAAAATSAAAASMAGRQCRSAGSISTNKTASVKELQVPGCGLNPTCDLNPICAPAFGQRSISDDGGAAPAASHPASHKRLVRGLTASKQTVPAAAAGAAGAGAVAVAGKQRSASVSSSEGSSGLSLSGTGCCRSVPDAVDGRGLLPASR